MQCSGCSDRTVPVLVVVVGSVEGVVFGLVSMVTCTLGGPYSLFTCSLSLSESSSFRPIPSGYPSPLIHSRGKLRGGRGGREGLPYGDVPLQYCIRHTCSQSSLARLDFSFWEQDYSQSWSGALCGIFSTRTVAIEVSVQTETELATCPVQKLT